MNKDIYKYIPHRKKMALLNCILDKSEENFLAEVKINEESLLITPLGVPAYCAIEYMAQSIAAFNSLNYEGEAQGPKLGFIIAVRSFKSDVDYFKIGDVLNIKVDPVLVVNSSGSFNCDILIEGNSVAKGRITAYVPTEDEIKELKKRSA